MKARIKGPQHLIGPIPQNDHLRLLLTIFRRMGAHSLRDAAACNMMMQHLGSAYRRPYLLMQAMMLDLSRHCRINLTIAPSCCRRMTTDEAQLIAIITATETNPQRAMTLLSDLTGNAECHAILATIDAVKEAFASLGRPLVE
ncbi:MAG: hypothetical protein KAZ17_02545 [Sphingorhabdus sp.]|nr:hypothetical protein [Sphingorhabdus sp.]